MTNPYSELIKEVRDGCIGVSALYSVFANREHRLQRKIYRLLGVLLAVAVMILLCLVILDLRLFKALESTPVIEPGSPLEIHHAVPRFDPALPERFFEKPISHPYDA